MIKSPDRVSIGLPVYNGARFLGQAIESLLCQTYLNFELIISDNCSTDATPEICRDYVRRDSRVRFYQNESNIGAAKNFCRVFELASGKYFMWAAHDDLWDKDYVAKCVAALERYSSIVLCATDIRFIDQEGSVVTGRGMRAVGGQYNRLNTFRMELRRRVSELTRELNWYAIYGMMRTDALIKTELIRDVYGTDVILLMELLLQGETLILPERLFAYRVQRKTASDQLRDVTGQDTRAPKLSPYTDLARNLLSVIDHAGFTAAIKSQLTNDLIKNISQRNRRWRRLIAKENSGAKSASRLEQARIVRRLFTAQSIDDEPATPLQAFVREAIYRLGAVGVHVRRTVDKLSS